jgi:hypothetical protein
MKMTMSAKFGSKDSISEEFAGGDGFLVNEASVMGVEDIRGEELEEMKVWETDLSSSFDSSTFEKIGQVISSTAKDTVGEIKSGFLRASGGDHRQLGHCFEIIVEANEKKGTTDDGDDFKLPFDANPKGNEDVGVGVSAEDEDDLQKVDEMAADTDEEGHEPKSKTEPGSGIPFQVNPKENEDIGIIPEHKDDLQEVDETVPDAGDEGHEPKTKPGSELPFQVNSKDIWISAEDKEWQEVNETVANVGEDGHAAKTEPRHFQVSPKDNEVNPEDKDDLEDVNESAACADEEEHEPRNNFGSVLPFQVNQEDNEVIRIIQRI